MKLLSLLALTIPILSAASFRIAPFDADVTPQLGEPLIWTTPTSVIKDKLHAKGIILESGRDRYVLCAVDWCGLGNRSHETLRAKLAKAAGTTVDRVAVQSLHQHTAPYLDGSAYDLLRASGVPITEFSDAALSRIADQTATAVAQASRHLQPFDRIGTGMAVVDRVASTRRLPAPDGKVVVRFSNGAKSPELASAPEGAIDPDIRTIAFARGDRTIARLYYYATHPQTWCCDGKVSADAIGGARARLEAQEKTAQIYFTGCGGDVTVGKYNDGGDAAREQIEQRLFSGMERAIHATVWKPVRQIGWKTAPLRLPVAPDAAAKARDFNAQVAEPVRYRSALSVAFAKRTEPLTVSMLAIDEVRILHLPGEPMLEFQRYAQSLGTGRFVAVAGYGNMTSGYICTDQAYDQGGYEPSASNTTKGAEAALKQTLRTLLEEK